MFKYFFILYLLCIITLGLLSVAQYPVYTITASIVAHVLLFFLVFSKRCVLFQNYFSSLKSLLILAVLLRFIFIWHAPGDDLARYAWEGKQVALGVNPYLHAPLWFTEADMQSLSLSDKAKISKMMENRIDANKQTLSDKNISVFLNELLINQNLSELLKGKAGVFSPNVAEVYSDKEIALAINNRMMITSNFSSLQDDFQENVNHKQLSAIYPPITLLIFSVLMKISYSLLTFKVFFFICEFVSIVFILLILKKMEKPLHWALIYIMSPLILLYGVGECHLDILQNTLVLSGLYFSLFSSQKRWWVLGFLLIGCAVLIKYLAIIVVPFLIRRNNYYLLFFFLIPFASYLYFLEPEMLASLAIFSEQMHFNDFMPRIFRWFALDGGSWYPVLMISAYVFGYFWIWLFYQDVPLKGILLAWLWLLLCLPVVHPWYLISVLMLLAFYPRRNVFYFSMIMSFYFFVLAFQFNHEGQWVEFWWLPLITYFGFLVITILEKNKLFPLGAEEFSKPKNLDIIIPVYNEGHKINETLIALFLEIEEFKKSSNIEINVIVVDGGSVDNTFQTLNNYPILKLKNNARGRGNQLAYGFENSKSDLVLFLHADSRLATGALMQLFSAVSDNPILSWGVLGHIYDEKNFKLKTIEILNRFRFRILGIAFGDQGMFFRREVIKNIGVPSVPLMEDVEMSLRLFKYPSKINLNGLLIGSARRWQKRKFVNNFFQVIYLCLKYLLCRRLGADIKAVSDKMYKIYYS